MLKIEKEELASLHPEDDIIVVVESQRTNEPVILYEPDGTLHPLFFNKTQTDQNVYAAIVCEIETARGTARWIYLPDRQAGAAIPAWETLIRRGAVSLYRDIADSRST